MKCTVKEGGDIEQYFQQVKIDKLPNNMKPKFTVGDLVRIVFRSDDGVGSFRIKDNHGLICEILFYECRDYGVDYPYANDRDNYYLVEYKILPTGKDKYRYISEENLRRIEND